MDINKHEVKVRVSRKLREKDHDAIAEVASKVINYLEKKQGTDQGFTGLSFRGSENRSIYYTYPKEGIFNKPLKLSDEPAPVGTTGLTTAV